MIVSVAGQMHSMIEGVLSFVILRHRRILTGAKWEEGKY